MRKNEKENKTLNKNSSRFQQQAQGKIPPHLLHKKRSMWLEEREREKVCKAHSKRIELKSHEEELK